MAKARVEMDRLSIPKASAAGPFAPAPSPEAASFGGGEFLTMKLQAVDHGTPRGAPPAEQRRAGRSR
jgi:hypothetical protein